MKVELLKNIANCCDKDTTKPMAYPTLIKGELWACDGVVAVRYKEAGWDRLPCPDVPWQIRDEEYKNLKPRDMLLFDSRGFFATDVHGNMLDREGMGQAAPDKYPDFPSLWGNMLPKGIEAGRIDPKQLRRVIGVFQTAGVFPYVESTRSGLKLWGTRSFAGFVPYIEAIVCGMRS